jgi:putative ABC transport system ATP-binding protein
MDKVISVRELSKTYQLGDHAVHALRSVSLDVERGEFVSVIGPSGSGKSTLMHILGCLDQPTSGQYILDGKDVSRLTDDEVSLVRNERIGFVFQGFNLLTRTSALENVELPLLYGKTDVSSTERRKRAMLALQAVGLESRWSHHTNQLSGGQQQRVAIARALLNNPSILLADEPTGNLDSKTSLEVMEIFQKLQVERGITIVLITHEAEVAEYGTRIITFRDGKILSDVPNVQKRHDAGAMDATAAVAAEAVS